MTIAEEKQAQRAAGRAARKALDAPQRAAANAALCRRVLELDAYRAAHTLLLYAAFGGEADLAAVAAEAVRQGKTVAYPVCGEGFTLIAAVPGVDGWAVGQYGIRARYRNAPRFCSRSSWIWCWCPAPPLTQTAAGWAWARATTTAICPAAPGR